MSEYQYVIDTLKHLAYADEGDQITHSDLNECDTAAAIILDLESDVATLQKSEEAAKAELEKIRVEIHRHNRHLDDLCEFSRNDRRCAASVCRGRKCSDCPTQYKFDMSEFDSDSGEQAREVGPEVSEAFIEKVKGAAKQDIGRLLKDGGDTAGGE